MPQLGTQYGSVSGTELIDNLPDIYCHILKYYQPVRAVSKCDGKDMYWIRFDGIGYLVGTKEDLDKFARMSKEDG